MQWRLSVITPSCRAFLQPPYLTRSLLLFSTSHPDFLPSYLVTKCGFSPEKATEASKHLGRVKSPDQPDSVIAFFKSQGFRDSHLTKLFKIHPQWLARDVEVSFAPKVRSLHEMGITGSDLVNLVISHPNILGANIERTFVPMFEFWRRVFGSDKLVMKCFQNRWMFGYNLEKLVKNLSFLQDCGLSDHQIRLILSREPFIICQKAESLNKLVSRVESLMLPRGSPNFHWALYFLSKCGEEKLTAQLETMKSFGWSNNDIFAAFRKLPQLFPLSSKSLKEKMEFLVKEAGCDASYITRQPELLAYSLKKRIIPRVAILKVLKEKGLSCGKHKLYSAVHYTKGKFFEKYVAPYKEEIPELSQLFSATS